MTTMEQTAVTTQVYRVYINAAPQAIWDAITTPEWAERYGYRAQAEYDLRPGGAYRALATKAMLEMGAPEVIVEGEVLEADPPRRLVQTYRFMWDPELVAEGFTRVTWEIEEELKLSGVSRLTVTHELEGAPKHAAQVASAVPIRQGGGGWSWILSDLKTVLETGASLGS